MINLYLPHHSLTIRNDAIKFLIFRTPEPKIQTKRPKLRELHHNNATGIANSEDPDQTAPLGAV